MANTRKFIDIGANLTDLMFDGIYNGTRKHQPDLLNVLERSWNSGLSKIIVTGGSLSESRKALKISKENDNLFCTVGCHPTRCLEFEADSTKPEKYLQDLKETIEMAKSKIIAVGECGLDYERIQFCPKNIQKKYFEMQLTLAEEFKLPLFLHCRNAAEDLYNILSKYENLRGVVHSFDGTPEEASSFIKLGYYIGLNGCSLKTLNNLETVKSLQLDRILLETDCPWCEIRPSHEGYKFISKENRAIPTVKKEKWNENAMVKSRNEPSNIRQVFDIVAAVRNEDPDTLRRTIYQNTMKLFFPNQQETNVLQ